ncbi:MAG: MFS transporter [Rhodoferax sp.]|nr:MFS transporter [Rhodoferax sp.]
MKYSSKSPPAEPGRAFALRRSEAPGASTRSHAATPARGALASLSLTMLLSSLGTSIANVGLPTLAQAFHAPFQQVQWVVLAYLLAITTLIVSVGRIGDLLGRRRLMLGGIALFTVASVLCASAASLWQLVAARALQGLGAAVMMALTMAMVGEAVPKAKAGSAMGLLGTMSAVGTAMGPTLGGVLIAAVGWQAMFLVNLPLGLLALAMVWRYLPVDGSSGSAGRAGFDLAGSLVLVFVLAAYALSMTTGRGNFGVVNLTLLLVAALGVGLFVRIESRAPSALLRPALFQDPVLRAGFMMSALVTTVVMATLVVGPFYLAGALGLGAAGVGLVMSSGPVVAALTGVPAGRAVDRFGAAAMTMAGLLTMAVGTLLLALLPASLGAAGYVLALVVTTAGYATFQAANNTAVMADVRADQRGVVSGLLNLSRNLGLITGAAVMGAVFAFGSSAAAQGLPRPLAAARGMQLTFAVATLLIVMALAIAGVQRMRARRMAVASR